MTLPPVVLVYSTVYHLVTQTMSGDKMRQTVVPETRKYHDASIIIIQYPSYQNFEVIQSVSKAIHH